MLFVAVLWCNMMVLLKYAALSARPKKVLTWGILRINLYDANRIHSARTAHVLVHNMYFDNPFSHNKVTATKKCMLTFAYDQNSVADELKFEDYDVFGQGYNFIGISRILRAWVSYTFLLPTCFLQYHINKGIKMTQSTGQMGWTRNAELLPPSEADVW